MSLLFVILSAIAIGNETDSVLKTAYVGKKMQQIKKIIKIKLFFSCYGCFRDLHHFRRHLDFCECFASNWN